MLELLIINDVIVFIETDFVVNCNVMEVFFFNLHGIALLSYPVLIDIF